MGIKEEILLYVFIACLLSAIRRIISGADNGCFYAKGNLPYPKLLEKYIKNIHFLETPSWYSQFGFQFLLCLAIFRIFHMGGGAMGYGIALLGAYLTTMGSSAVAGVFYQGFINVGSGKPFINATESTDFDYSGTEGGGKSEFALFGTSFWWYRPVHGRRRIYASVIGFITLTIGIYFGLYYKTII